MTDRSDLGQGSHNGNVREVSARIFAVADIRLVAVVGHGEQNVCRFRRRQRAGFHVHGERVFAFSLNRR